MVVLVAISKLLAGNISKKLLHEDCVGTSPNNTLKSVLCIFVFWTI